MKHQVEEQELSDCWLANNNNNVSLSICLSVCLFVWVSVCLSAQLSWFKCIALKLTFCLVYQTCNSSRTSLSKGLCHPSNLVKAISKLYCLQNWRLCEKSIMIYSFYLHQQGSHDPGHDGHRWILHPCHVGSQGCPLLRRPKVVLAPPLPTHHGSVIICLNHINFFFSNESRHIYVKVKCLIDSVPQQNVDEIVSFSSLYLLNCVFPLLFDSYLHWTTYNLQSAKQAVD